MPAIPAIIAAGATIYAAHKASSSANDAANLQVQGVNHAADLTKQSNDAALAFSKQQADVTNTQHEAAQKGNYDQWAYRQGGLNSLGSAVGLGDRPLPSYVPSTPNNFGSAASGAPAPAGGAPAAAGSSGAGPSAFIKGLLDQGMNPQQAVQQTNQQFGLKTGSEAVYYDPSQHGGTATIGLPDAYLALTNGQWNVTPRQGGGGQMSTQPQARTLGSAISQARPNTALMVAPSPLAPPPSNFGAAFGGGY